MKNFIMWKFSLKSKLYYVVARTILPRQWGTIELVITMPKYIRMHIFFSVTPPNS